MLFPDDITSFLFKLLQLLEIWDTNDSEGSILLCLDPFVSFLCLVKHKKKYLTAGSTIILRYFPMEKMEKANLESFTILEKNNENSNNDISWIHQLKEWTPP